MVHPFFLLSQPSHDYIHDFGLLDFLVTIVMHCFAIAVFRFAFARSRLIFGAGESQNVCPGCIFCHTHNITYWHKNGVLSSHIWSQFIWLGGGGGGRGVVSVMCLAVHNDVFFFLHPALSLLRSFDDHLFVFQHFVDVNLHLNFTHYIIQLATYTILHIAARMVAHIIFKWAGKCGNFLDTRCANRHRQH